ERQQLRPGERAVIAPNREQRHAVIDLGVLEQALAGEPAAAALQRLEVAQMLARGRPQVPGGNAAAVPARGLVGPAVAPQVAVPAEAKHRLAAHAAMAQAL